MTKALLERTTEAADALDETSKSLGPQTRAQSASVGNSRAQVTVRAVALRIHRYVGLGIAVFLLVAGLTGSALAFYQELEAVLNPGLFRVAGPAGAAQPMDPIALREGLQAKLKAGAYANYVPLQQKEGQALRFLVDLPEAAQSSADDEYFVDPYTGNVLGSRRWGDLTQGSKNLMPFVYRLHFSLALGEVGTYLLGIAALLWTIDCFVGAYLTFPPRRRGSAPLAQGRSWLSRWKPSWLLRTTKLFSLVFTWHRASGLWVWGMLFVFAWSAVGLNLSEVYNPVMKAAFGLEDRVQRRLPALDRPQSKPKLSWRQAQRTGQTLMAAQAHANSFTVKGERRLSYQPERGAFRYQVHSSLDISERYPATAVWFDQEHGQLLAFEAPTGQTAGNTITTWLSHLHFGSLAAGGLPYRIFVSFMGLAVALLSVSGVWIWWKRKKRA